MKESDPISKNDSLVQVCISLGSNINPHENIERALQEIRQELQVIKVSSTWESPPYKSDGDCFLNAAVLAETHLDGPTLKNSILMKIEKKLGRVRTEDKFAPRTIDLDIVIFDNQILDESLWEFAFVTLPVSEILPELKNPITGEPIQQIAESLSRKVGIQKVEETGKLNSQR